MHVIHKWSAMLPRINSQAEMLSRNRSVYSGHAHVLKLPADSMAKQVLSALVISIPFELLEVAQPDESRELIGHRFKL